MSCTGVLTGREQDKMERLFPTIRPFCWEMARGKEKEIMVRRDLFRLKNGNDSIMPPAPQAQDQFRIEQ